MRRQSLLKYVIFAIVATFLTATNANAQSTSVGSPSNPGALGAAIVAAYNAGYRTITINPGTYTLPDVSTPMCTMTGWTNTTIIATGVTMVNTDAVNLSNIFYLNGCNNVTINGGTYSETVMPCYQGHVTGIGATAGNGDETLDVNFDSGYPLPPTGTDVWLNGVDQNTLQFKAGTGDYYDCIITSLGGGSYDVDFGSKTVPMVAGDIVFGRTPSAPQKFQVYECQSCTIENVTMYRNGFAAIFEHECPGGDHFLGDTWAQGPAPTGGTYTPVFCCAADGIHSVDQNVGPDIENCQFDGLLQDDCIAIHGSYQTVTAVSGNTITVDNGYGYLSQNAVVRMVGANFYAKGTITQIVNNSNGTQTLTMDKSYAVPVGGGVSNPSYCGPGYKIIDCVLGGTRSRGIIAKADNGTIEGNTISGTLAQGIFIGDDTAGDGEAGFSQNVTIENNSFSNLGTYPAILVNSDANAQGNANTTIENNVFNNCAANQITINGDNTAMVSNNTYLNTYFVPNSDRNEIDLFLDNNVTFSANVFSNIGPAANAGLVYQNTCTNTNGATDGVYDLDNHFNFQLQVDGLYLDAPTYPVGTVLDQQTLANANQQWDLTPAPNDPGYFTMQNVGEGEEFNTVNSSTAGAYLYDEDQILSGTYPASQQLWSMVPVDSTHVNIINASSQLDINDIGSNTNSGTDQCEFYPGNSTGQNWTPVSISLANGNYTLIPHNASGSVLDAAGGGTSNGTKVDIWPTNGGTNQSWTFTNEGANVYKIQPSYDTSLCLDVASGGTANGTDIDLYTDNGGGSGQRFEVVAAPGGGYQILPLNIATSRVEVQGSSNTSGTQIDISATTSAPNQVWDINPTGSAAEAYSVAASPTSVSIARGSNGASVISVVGTNGFDEPVTLTASGAPTGVSCAFSPTSISTNTTSTLTISTNSSATPGTYAITVTGTSGSLTHTTTVTVTVAGPVQVSLSSYFNLIGIYTDGGTFTGGIDGSGYALSGTTLGTSQTWSSAPFNIGAAGSSNVVSSTGQSITLPSGPVNFSHLYVLAAPVNGNESSQTLSVGYTSGSASNFTQSFSDWCNPQSYANEAKAVPMTYRDSASGGRQTINCYVYGYIFAIDNTRVANSLTLPNSSNLKIIAVTLVP